MRWISFPVAAALTGLVLEAPAGLAQETCPFGVEVVLCFVENTVNEVLEQDPTGLLPSSLEIPQPVPEGPEAPVSRFAHGQVEAGFSYVHTTEAQVSGSVQETSNRTFESERELAGNLSPWLQQATTYAFDTLHSIEEEGSGALSGAVDGGFDLLHEYEEGVSGGAQGVSESGFSLVHGAEAQASTILTSAVNNGFVFLHETEAGASSSLSDATGETWEALHEQEEALAAALYTLVSMADGPTAIAIATAEQGLVRVGIEPCPTSQGGGFQIQGGPCQLQGIAGYDPSPAPGLATTVPASNQAPTFPSPGQRPAHDPDTQARANNCGPSAPILFAAWTRGHDAVYTTCLGYPSTTLLGFWGGNTVSFQPSVQGQNPTLTVRSPDGPGKIYRFRLLVNQVAIDYVSDYGIPPSLSLEFRGMRMDTAISPLLGTRVEPKISVRYTADAPYWSSLWAGIQVRPDAGSHWETAYNLQLGEIPGATGAQPTGFDVVVEWPERVDGEGGEKYRGIVVDYDIVPERNGFVPLLASWGRGADAIQIGVSLLPASLDLEARFKEENQVRKIVVQNVVSSVPLGRLWVQFPEGAELSRALVKGLQELAEFKFVDTPTDFGTRPVCDWEGVTQFQRRGGMAFFGRQRCITVRDGFGGADLSQVQVELSLGGGVVRVGNLPINGIVSAAIGPGSWISGFSDRGSNGGPWVQIDNAQFDGAKVEYLRLERLQAFAFIPGAPCGLDGPGVHVDVRYYDFAGILHADLEVDAIDVSFRVAGLSGVQLFMNDPEKPHAFHIWSDDPSPLGGVSISSLKMN